MADKKAFTVHVQNTSRVEVEAETWQEAKVLVEKGILLNEYDTMQEIQQMADRWEVTFVNEDE